MEELLATHQHALARIASIYQFFKSFESEHGKEMRVLVDTIVCVGAYERLHHNLCIHCQLMDTHCYVCARLDRYDGDIKQLEALYNIAVRAENYGSERWGASCSLHVSVN